MTEQPKFQRRKRREEASADVQPKRTPERNDTPTLDEIDALIAEKEALLRQRAELEALRKKEAARDAERVRAAEEAEEQARKEKAARDAELKAQRAAEREARLEAELVAKREAELETQRKGDVEQTAKLTSPLVLTSQPDAAPGKTEVFDREAAWNAIDRFPLDPQRLADRNVITALRQDPSHTRFDILRTRMLQALSENGWTRVAITSPTKDCGKTFTAANLAISLSRQENCRTVLLDLDMRSPSLHKIFGVTDTGAVGDMLRGQIAPEVHLQGFAPNTISAGSHVAIGFNGIVEPYAAELLQDPKTQAVLDDIEAKFQPSVMLFDLPPALLNDDVIAMLPHIDALLIVAAGGMTRAKEIKETERRLGDKVPLLGVVLNKAEHVETGDYPY
ncbi:MULTISPECIES: P-loop NTPase [Marivita]|uniref:Exopolysaccharide biosynthesis protein n=1 Tax=Marivita cryptomonadis TaxID=505252 RepID=A0A9Q2RYM1_9RHOB|nr:MULTISPECIES: P-loop NTPase [Marivita]MCR9167006.1 P-loop NTPase [Paracoccaceae bacterium]MBM2322853.1 exopolysaccharide biosynthesis protein [Marivita cryptomonadis]MBM2332595.1 exopolysaccharide biosynthesis protein [Marivita cryptomonadis]MBM2342178.1 exopolysaccharide biosynthesis protein [Marivita cryptomonadis]MBM2346683.1 exopolysaccharide biosynthesis protein [Marivita cryptomonadis]